MLFNSYFNCFDDGIMKKLNNLMIAIIVVSQQIDDASQPIHAFRHSGVFYLSFAILTSWDCYSLAKREKRFLRKRACYTSFQIISEGEKEKVRLIKDFREIKILFTLSSTLAYKTYPL